MPKKRDRALTPDQLKALPIPIGEARKLLNLKEDMSDEDVARLILRVSNLASLLIKTLYLQK